MPSHAISDEAATTDDLSNEEPASYFNDDKSAAAKLARGHVQQRRRLDGLCKLGKALLDFSKLAWLRGVVVCKERDLN